MAHRPRGVRLRESSGDKKTRQERFDEIRRQGRIRVEDSSRLERATAFRAAPLMTSRSIACIFRKPRRDPVAALRAFSAVRCCRHAMLRAR